MNSVLPHPRAAAGKNVFPVLSDPNSPFDNLVIPDYNGEGRVPRAGSTSGLTGGADAFGLGSAEAFVGGTALNVVSPDFSPGASPIPPYATFVFVMRVK
jgi:hypothetical protein